MGKPNQTIRIEMVEVAHDDFVMDDLYKVRFEHPSCESPSFRLLFAESGQSPTGSVPLGKDDLAAGDPIWEFTDMQPPLLSFAGRFLRFNRANLTVKTFYVDDAGAALRVSIPLGSVVIVPSCSVRARRYLPQTRDSIGTEPYESIALVAAGVSSVFDQISPAITTVVPPVGTQATATGQDAFRDTRAALTTLTALVQADSVAGGVYSALS